MDRFLGTMLDNRYEILEVIGTGGMAVVYKARCHRLNRLVAVKIMKEDLALDAEFRRRFQTESQAVAMMSHPNIVAVYDVSKSDDLEYIVMELIEGITLKQYMNRKGQLNWKESLHFASQITKALSHAHGRGIIHRDIKPHNIMILKDGSVKVADFGIARLQSDQATTLTQEALGSVHYISPEQAKGSKVDARTDIYSLGVVMYEMLTNKLPFEGDSPVSVAIQHISAIPLRPSEVNPDIPGGLENITMKAMNPDLDARYQSADELLQDLEEFRKNPDKDFSALAAGAALGAVAGAAAAKVAAAPKKQDENPRADASKGKKKKEMSKKEYDKKKRKSRRVSTLVGIFCILILLIVLVVFMWQLVLKDIFGSSERVTIEDFTGMVYSEVISNTEYTDIYDFTLEEEENDEVEEGKIISQNPAGGRSVVWEEGSKIEVTLTVSVGSEAIAMPDLTNISRNNAKITLNGLGVKSLTILEEEISDSEITAGYVVKTVPVAGTALNDGDTVYIFVSTGPEVTTVEVPDLYGYSQSKATQLLRNEDLKVGNITYEENSASAGTVVGQSIRKGTTVETGTAVDIVISMGPPAATTAPPTDTPTTAPPTTTPPTAPPEGT